MAASMRRFLGLLMCWFWLVLSLNLLLVAAKTPLTPSELSASSRGGATVPKRGEAADSEIPLGSTVASGYHSAQETIHIVKRDGRKELMDPTKIHGFLEALCEGLENVDVADLTAKIVKGLYPNVSAQEINTLAAESSASLSTQHPEYARLAARIAVSDNHKTTNSSFSEAFMLLQDHMDPHLVQLVEKHADLIDSKIHHERDAELTYFGYKTLERAYLMRKADRVIERPQYLLMRVALGIHCCGSTDPEEECLRNAFETYEMMSQGYFTHASPTLFHAGTKHPQLASCFLVQMSEDSIAGIYETLSRCAVISKAAGGIGLSVHNIRARGTEIQGTRGVSNGLVPMLRVYDVTSRYVDQGGGKRPGAFAVYLEPWHADVFDVLNLKKNHGKEEQRARNLFYALWIPDLFMKRVEEDGLWSLMCPRKCPGLSECYGKDFESLYLQYEGRKQFVRQVRARELWTAILESQIETGTPYMLYKDACNAKSNQQNLGTIQCSNLCTEIIQYTDSNEVAVCNLASICLSKFVVSERGRVGSIDPKSGKAYFDHEALHRVAKMVVRNLNKVIDINHYPVDGSRTSNMKHRPIGMGVSGLADTFLRLGLPFASRGARMLNEAIFETLYNAGLEASAELAEEQGPYESFKGSPASKGKLQYHLWGINDEDVPSRKYLSSDSDECPIQHYHPTVCSLKSYDWEGLRKRITSTGLRNSLLLAPMPTASTSQILGVNECFEPFSSNLYIRRVKAGEFIMVNPHLLQDLSDRGLWTKSVRNQMMRDSGSIQNIPIIPDRLKELYKTVWEMKMKDIIDMAADRGKFVDQSQSLNLFIAEPTMDKLTAMHFYAWKKGLKTGMYYLRTKPAVNAIQYTVEKDVEPVFAGLPEAGDDSNICLSCQG